MHGNALWRQALIAATVTALPVLAQSDGELDASFHFDGRYLVSMPDASGTFRAVLEAPDGRIVAVGSRKATGEPPTPYWVAFSDSGAPFECVIAPPAGGQGAELDAAGFDRWGRLVVAGRVESAPVFGTEGLAARFLYPSCALDTTFNLDGAYRTNLTPFVWFSALAFASNDKVLLAGRTSDGDGLVVRLTAGNGNPDLGFDGDGMRFLQFATEVTELSNVVVQPDDRILLAGGLRKDQASGGDVDFLVLRLEPTGALDGTFSSDGRQTVEFEAGVDEEAKAIVYDPEHGDLLLAGQTSNQIRRGVAARLTASGELDPDFADAGRWLATVPDRSQLLAGARQSDGKYLLAGWGWDLGGDGDFVAYRLTRDGEPDLSFADSGLARIPIDEGGGYTDVGYGVGLQGGRPVLAGEADTEFGRDPAIVRLTNRLVFTDGFERGSTGGWSAKAP